MGRIDRNRRTICGAGRATPPQACRSREPLALGPVGEPQLNLLSRRSNTPGSLNIGSSSPSKNIPPSATSTESTWKLYHCTVVLRISSSPVVHVFAPGRRGDSVYQSTADDVSLGRCRAFSAHAEIDQWAAECVAHRVCGIGHKGAGRESGKAGNPEKADTGRQPNRTKHSLLSVASGTDLFQP